MTPSGASEPYTIEARGGGARVPLIDPETGLALRYVPGRFEILTDGKGSDWPIVEGIPFLRVGRDALRYEVLDRLAAGDRRGALIALLADQDDFARTPPPDPSALGGLVDDLYAGGLLFRRAMSVLGFGPVVDYFAYRESTPTYLSGLALLAKHWVPGALVVEVACGVGHFLAALSCQALGVDVVFAKLWLMRYFLVATQPLVCADVAKGFPLGAAQGPALVLCHDAFYFLPDKGRVAGRFMDLVGDRGRILIGHAHNRLVDQRGVAGEPLRPEEYAALFPGCTLYDDAELAREAWAGTPAPRREWPDLSGAEAIALAWSASGDLAATSPPDFLRPTAGTPLRLNPLLVDDRGTLRPRWPSPRFEEEYAAGSSYLLGEPTPDPATLRRAAAGEIDDRIAALARRRILVSTPERW